jgi:hypothetical protein
MGCARFLHVVMMALCVGVMAVHAVAAEVVAVSPVSRIEVVLASQYKNQIAAVTEEFVQAGMPNVWVGMFQLIRHEKRFGWHSSTISVWEFFYLRDCSLHDLSRSHHRTTTTQLNIPSIRPLLPNYRMKPLRPKSFTASTRV